MKKKTKIVLRSFYLSSVIIFCAIFGFYGIAKAYENIRLIGFGEYRNTIEIEEDKIKIFDFEINYK